MKFEEALLVLKNGVKIRRNDWGDKSYYLFLDDDGYICGSDSFSFAFRYCDIVADDWEVVKEIKKVKLRDLTPAQIKKWKLKECSSTDCNKCLYAICWFYHKSFYSDEFLDQEIEIEIGENEIEGLN